MCKDMPRKNAKERTAKLIEDGKKSRFKAGEEQAKIASKGGIESQRVQREKKTMRERIKMLVELPATEQQKQALKRLYGDDIPEDVTIYDVMATGQVQSAVKGNTKAFEMITQYVGDTEKKDDEKPFELPARVIGRAFVDVNRHIEPNKDNIFKGGRGALKSSYVSCKILEIMRQNPFMHACIVRKVGNTLKDSVYAQMLWAINILGLADQYEAKKSPLEIVDKKTKQTIYFRGVDDPLKLKSIKPPFGYIGILWIEERDQIGGASEERSIKQSVLRGGDTSYFFASYNPPKSKSNWVNIEELTPNPNRLIHASTYLEAPPEWLGKKFIEDAEHLKEVNPDAYDHEYMGISNGEGGNVFTNMEVRDITDEEIATFDNIKQGVDWGWYPDPFAFVRLHYDTARECIYFIDEIGENKKTNSETAQMIIEHGYNDFIVTCDSAEPKSVNDYIDAGISARRAIKGAGSIDYGIKFLQGRTLVIDPKRTPRAYNEFINYEYLRDKDDNVISGYPDKDNHFIDATRYAMEQTANSRGTSA